MPSQRKDFPLWQAQAYVHATRRKQLKDNFHLQAEQEQSYMKGIPEL